MQEFQLFSLIPALREHQVLNLLAGVTGSQPVKIHEQHLVFAQLRLPEIAVSRRAPAKQQQGQPPRLGHHQLVRSVRDSDDNDSEPALWRLRVDQVPEAGAAVISRPVSEAEATPAELERLKNRSIYQFKSEYFTHGVRFVHGNIMVCVYRIYLRKESVTELPIDELTPTFADLKLLDVSGSFIVDATVRADDASNSKLLQQATQDLQAFSTMMQGAINFYAPDRLSLDPRMKNL